MLPQPIPRRLLVVATKTGYQTKALVEAGERLGYRIQLGTDRCHRLADPWGDGALPLDFDNPTLDPAESFDGILAAGDVAAQVASILASRLGLRFHTPQAVALSRNKFEARQRFASAGLPVPHFYRIPLDYSPAAQAPARFPVVLKPLGLSASRGVIRANDSAEFETAFHRIRKLLQGSEIRRHGQDLDRFIQVEEFIPGREYALECLITAGRLRVLAIFDKPDPLDGPFFEESIYVTPSRASSAEQQSMTATVARAAEALGLSEGPVHAEVRVNAAGVWMLEAAPRPIGGLCAKALRFESGRGLEEVLLRHAVGEDGDDETLRSGGSGVMMIPIPKSGIYRGVRGVDEAAATPGIEGLEITAMEGNELVALPEGHSYLGFLFAHARTPAEAEAALREAHAKLRFEISSVLPQLPA
jgi:biotin carboxylase